ncbi:hypothetical protein P152DRAFT_308236 [Eremomyces bilateralis CBS 781.70]|uniref:Uncharacterized protein n=1 Tax=Eremomyces bilateralis CBS 781.70 TaxID=1392243 RepID=A0A6G1G599_9PEZI|nr:uncharacterized protein P152DRAFT_308236 [Eremomyces bilateralis CBS 781.70]KAF1813182.1 hypothetical protein P152DRAFT_308236 [Eremomyces bilateralis CBS 781.70]
MLWSSITGTRPGVLLPDNCSPDALSRNDEDQQTTITPKPKRRKLNQTFVSDLPEYVSIDPSLKTVCKEDIELFYLRNPEGGRDVPCAIITFRNLKGRPEGSDGTRFFMHCDYLLTYCPILHIVAMAFRDGAFENERLTPELFWRLRVPKRLPSLPLRWKKDKLKFPVLRRMKQAPYGYEVDQFLPMKYDSSNSALKHIGEGLGYEDLPTHYNFRR